MLSNSKKLQQTELMRLDAMKTFLEIEMSNKLRTAILRKSRPFRGGFEIGQRLAYWRVRNTLDGEGPFAGYRQGVLIGMELVHVVHLFGSGMIVVVLCKSPENRPGL